MRDKAYWEGWLRKNADALRAEMTSIRDWYKAAGVSKGERRIFRSALKSVGADRIPRKAGKFRRRPETPEPAARDAAGGTAARPKARGDAGERLVEGRLRFTREGRPIVIPEDDAQPAVRIPGDALSGAWPKDRVQVRLERRRGGAPQYGQIVRVIERGIHTFVGRFFPAGDRSFVRFRDREADLRLPMDDGGRPPEAGDLVLAEVIEYPRGGKEGKARLVRALGKEHTMGTIALAVTASRDLPSAFSEAAEAQASRVHQSVRCAGNESEEGIARVDLRDLPFVTIDGADARDFDDAVCLVDRKGGPHLVVAIADVSHYVPPASAIDRDAYARGTSVYFPDRCIPMLPRALSEGVCSLKPGLNRLAVAVDIPLDANGHRRGAVEVVLAIIRSRARLTYDQVHGFLSGPGREEGVPGRGGGSDAEVGKMLRAMETLAGRLALARSGRGALDFDIPEPAIRVEDEVPVAIDAAPRYESHRLIEEFMLLANTAVAEFLSDRGFPFLFRIHEPPAEERVDAFEDTAARLLRRSKVTESRDVASRLRAWSAAARGSRYERHINMLLLRSLMLARYGPERKGHFGLALARYTHFTSPIRRYPDLIVHRALKAALGAESYGPFMERLAAEGEATGNHLSGREREAMEAEREVERRAKALFLSKRIGERFAGVVASVTPHGFYVELLEHYVEGFVPVRMLRDDVYRYSEERGEWFGTARRTRIGPGDEVLVRVFRADPDRGEVDLLLVEKRR